MPNTMDAVMKVAPTPGAKLRRHRVPNIRADEVLVKVEATSICGTDLHIYRWDAWAQGRIKPPLIIGHEFCGNVVAVGNKVKGVTVGDFVSGESHFPCRTCYQCRHDQMHICNNVRILGVDTDGCFAEYAVLPAICAWKNDKDLPVETAAVLEPLGNAVYCTLVEPVENRTVAIFGDGPAGLHSTAVARAAGAKKIFLVGKHDFRLKIGEKMGADIALNATETNDVSKSILEATGNQGVDVVLEMSGSQEAISQGFEIVKKGGRLSAFGIPSQPIKLDLSGDIVFKGVRVYGINGRLMFKTWRQMTKLIKAGKLDPRPVQTHKFKLREFQKAFSLLKLKEKVGKILLYN